MKILKKRIIMILSIALLINMPLIAQEDSEAKTPKFIVATTFHWNMDLEDFSMDDWKATEKEFFDKVTNKNEYILGTDVVMHYFTADNTEITFVATYGSWTDIEAAQKRNGELVKEAWPNEEDRKAFFKKKNSVYADEHSDEIYAPGSGHKLMTEKSTEPMVIYIQKRKLGSPDDGNQDEYSALTKEYNDAVIQKNDLIKGYFPNYHAWGSDRRDFIEVFAFTSLADVEKSFDKNEELVNAAWPDEAKRKEFFKNISKYYTGIHSDYIYHNVPELIK